MIRRLWCAWAAAMLAAGVMGCHGTLGIEVVGGSGDVVSESRQERGFSRIDLDGGGKLYFSEANVYRVEIRTDDNLVDYIETSVSGGVLHIGAAPRGVVIRPTSLRYYVAAPVLAGIVIDGSGNFVAENTIHADSFVFEINGSGDVELDLEASIANFLVDGSGDITLCGFAERVSWDLDGSGDFLAGNFQTLTALVDIDGSGNATVYATEALKVDIDGSGTVWYRGAPRVSKRVAGSGGVFPERR
jgi:hypothetical protein